MGPGQRIKAELAEAGSHVANEKCIVPAIEFDTAGCAAVRCSRGKAEFIINKSRSSVWGVE